MAENRVAATFGRFMGQMTVKREVGKLPREVKNDIWSNQCAEPSGVRMNTVMIEVGGKDATVADVKLKSTHSSLHGCTESR